MYKTETAQCDAVDPRTPRYYEAMIAALLKRIPTVGPERIPLHELTQDSGVSYEYDPQTGVIAVSLMPMPCVPVDSSKPWRG